MTAKVKMTPGVVLAPSRKTTPGVILTFALLLAFAVGASVSLRSATEQARPATDNGPAGVREAAWAPDGKRVAVSRFDAIWTMTPDGKDAKHVVTAPADFTVERDPAWSPDGQSIAFSAEQNGEFDIWIAPAKGGAAVRLTSMPGDERWPSWTSDRRIVFSHRQPKSAWQLFVFTQDQHAGTATKLASDDAEEWQGSVSPNGKLVAFVSSRDPEAGNESDIWVRELPAKDAGGSSPRSARVTRLAGNELHPTWAPDNARIAYVTMRGNQSAVWATAVPSLDAPAGRGGRRRPRTGRRAARRRRLGRSVDRGGHSGAGFAPSRRARVVARRPDAPHRDVSDDRRGLQRQSRSQRRGSADGICRSGGVRAVAAGRAPRG